ncbi:transglutaminase-like cysteine peptidase [Kiloniella sp. EL199]|uniref:transglutaminase-like cysteine peptidase n=1 Tax=Kiloniella sp. EL199 TaxID=2107581 RepID=UPI000EA0936C|nr:transglutaminase-like cysteine peptidase [Kiloniella sp. EL199]
MTEFKPLQVIKKAALIASLASVLVNTIPMDASHAQSLGDLAKAAKGKGTALFRTVEFRSKSFKALPQWARVLKKSKPEIRSFNACANNIANCKTPQQKSWRKIIHAAKNMSRRQKLDTVNKFFNRWPYKLDREVYGVSEYWASPNQFMRTSGDCEDYSIAKFYALKELGFKDNEMRIVILKDSIRGIGHAVLAIYEKNDILILDSLSNLILTHTKYRHYIPQYSMNSTTRWAHIK